MVPTAYVSHELLGRLRVRVPDRKGDDAYFARAGKALAQAKGVLAVEVNPVTASFLVLHESSTADLLAYAEAQGLFTVSPPTEDRESLLELAATGVSKVDELIYRATDGRSSLHEVLFVSLVGLAGLQALRGQALGPATALLSYAAGLLALYRPRALRTPRP